MSQFFPTLPKVGIRPTIDGRLGGVRESLEVQTLSMAKSTAKLISETLRYPTGEPVECVIADTTIGGVAEAAACAEKFRRENVGVSLTVTPCWCYGSETMDTDPLLPKAVWGFNGTERPGAVYLAAVLAGHAQKGLPAFGIYGRDVQESSDSEIPEDVREKILRFVRAGLAVALMRGKAYLAMGGTSMGIAGSIIEPSLFEEYLGMRVESVDMTEFLRRIERGIFDPQEFEKALGWAKKNCPEGKDWNSPDKKRNRRHLNEEWAISIKMTLIARDLMIGNPKLKKLGFGEEAHGHFAIASGFQGQRQWTDHMPNGDFMEAILNTSFDWNGRRAPYIVATENDALNAVSMLFGYLLTNTAQLFADVRTYWSPGAVLRVTGHELDGPAAGGFLHLINSGPAALDGSGRQTRNGNPAMKPFWDITDIEVQTCLEATTWHPSITEYFPGGGWSTRYVTPGGMPATICRINLVKGLGPTLQIAEGETVELPEKCHKTLEERTNPTWPTTWFVPRVTGNGAFRDVYTVMNNWGANHCALSYGHIGADLITLATLLRIPVYMHNVENIFRPNVWAAFGTEDTTSADFRACANFGPLYG
ncbi:MAG: L-fucose isomerase [Verrucomicrobia bacterium 61-8]|nr:L-fucose isomerase [Verrucomicrobiota bacterium]OJV25366.1 MAG: L-fucose isomerase [Verrucomicrobia bacterium 61-8]